MAFLSLLGVLLTCFFLTVVFYRQFRVQVEDDIQTEAELLAETGVFDDVSRKDQIHLDPDAVRVTWVAADGTVLYDNEADAKKMENHLTRPEIQQALKTGSGRMIRRSDTMNRSTYYYALKLENGTILRSAKTTRNLYAILMRAVPVMILICSVIVLLSIYLAHILTRSMVKPIEKMAEEIGSGSASPAYPELAPFANRLREQHEDILRGAKMRQDFTANVSHELKTPLTAISGYAELMENGMAEEKDTKRMAGEIRKNASRLLFLINDIIRLSQLDSFEEHTQFEEIDLNKIAEAVVSNLQVNAQKHTVSLTYQGTDACIHGNREMLSELITNLVDNAIRYNYPNGYVRVSVTKEEEGTCLTVKDNGIGIPKSSQKRIFERFYRVDKSRSRQTGGTGLGLAIVKHVVMIHNAKLDLDSAPGIGTTIRVIF